MLPTTPALKPHPAAELFPMMSAADLDALAADIREHGQREPIVLHKGLILDGRHRYAACQTLGIEPRTMEWAGSDDADEIEAYVNSLNLHRRHLTESQRAMIAARRANMRQGARTDLQPSANLPEVSQEEAAKRYHVSERSVRHASALQKKAAPELVQAVDRGEIPVSTAAKLVDLPKDRQRALATAGKKAATKSAKQVEVRRQAQRRPVAPTAPKETEHDKDLRFLRETWAATCASAHAAFLKELGLSLQVVA